MQNIGSPKPRLRKTLQNKGCGAPTILGIFPKLLAALRGIHPYLSTPVLSVAIFHAILADLIGDGGGLQALDIQTAAGTAVLGRRQVSLSTGCPSGGGGGLSKRLPS